MSTILIIDDDQTIRFVASEILKLSGYDVLFAENGRLGVEIAKNNLVDLIICDIEMPELDGYAVQKIVNAEPSLVHTPFIFLSGKDELSDIRKGMDLGADDYLVKPLQKTDLLSAIETRLSKIEKIKKFYNVSKFGMDNEGVQTLFDLTEEENSLICKKNKYIYQCGEVAKSFFYIKSGRVKVIKSNINGKEFVSDILIPGNFFGHEAILKKGYYNEDAFAYDEVTLIHISKEKLMSVLNLNPSISMELVQILNRKLELSEEKLVSLAYDSVRKRTADALIYLENKFKKHEFDKQVEIKISRDDLAALVGTATETVIRVVGDFKKDKILEVKGRTIRILEMEKLKNQNY